MIPLDPRYKPLLALLLDSHTPVPASTLARQMETSPRVVRYQARRLDAWLTTRGLTLECRPGLGLMLQVSEAEREQLRREIDCLPPDVRCCSARDRLQITLLLLLVRGQPITIKEIQHELQVARMTVVADLEKVEEWLKDFGLALTRRQNVGCQVTGSESELRRALVALAVETFGEIQLLASFGNLNLSKPLTLPERSPAAHRVGAFLRNLNLDLFHATTEQIQDLLGVTFTDHAHMKIALNMGVQAYRIRLGQLADPPPPEEIREMRANPLFEPLQRVTDRVEERLGMVFPEAEIIFLLKLVQSAAPQARPEMITASESPQEAALEKIVAAVIDTATLYLHPALAQDQSLRVNIEAHLRLGLGLSRDVPPENPFLLEIKKSYPEIYQLTQTCLATVGQEIGWTASEGEVGFITMHLAAAVERLRSRSVTRKKVVIVCNSGVATSSLLAARVRAEFPDLVIQGVMSYLEYKNQKACEDCDLVISTVPIPVWEKPAIIVGPFLEEADVRQIRQALRAFDTSPAPPTADLTADRENGFGLDQPSLKDFLTAETIKLQVKARDWLEVIEQAGQLLVTAGCVEPRYIEAMVRVREEYGPYMVIMPGVALLHAFPEDGVRRAGMSLVTLRHPVPFGHVKYDPVSLAIVLAAPDHHTHLRGLAELMQLLRDTQARQDLQRAVHLARVLRLVAKASGA